MIIKECKGYELEKAKPNTSEDFFNRSEITFNDNGEERTLHVLYLRYFDELMTDFTPYTEDPIFEVGGRAVTLKDIVALVTLIKNPGYRSRKRIYVNKIEELTDIFQNVNYDKIKTVFQALENGSSFELRAPLEFIVQP